MIKTRTLLCISLFLLWGSTIDAQNLAKLGNQKYAETLNDVWGYVDSAGNEYALVGVFDGVSIVDVTLPGSPNELFFIPGPGSTWRDLVTYNNYAYVSNGADSGILIIDLTGLPGNAPYTWFSADSAMQAAGDEILGVHNLWVDENGFMYLFGSNLGVGGAEIFDLADPNNPLRVGTYSTNYVHDGFVRGDTLWAAEIVVGHFAIINVSDKANPVVMATQTTPNLSTHNLWPSDDNQVVFTTDEESSAYVVSYDVSDLSNIRELDRIRSMHSNGVIPHNTHFMNDFLITSWYTDGVLIHDVSRPANMVEVGNFDTNPRAGGTFSGNWGVYPYLPSGNILVTDGDSGLFILGPT